MEGREGKEGGRKRENGRVGRKKRRGRRRGREGRKEKGWEIGKEGRIFKQTMELHILEFLSEDHQPDNATMM